jgi:hypothetical protein
VLFRSTIFLYSFHLEFILVIVIFPSFISLSPICLLCLCLSLPLFYRAYVSALDSLVSLSFRLSPPQHPSLPTLLSLPLLYPPSQPSFLVLYLFNLSSAPLPPSPALIPALRLLFSRLIPPLLPASHVLASLFILPCSPS